MSKYLDHDPDISGSRGGGKRGPSGASGLAHALLSLLTCLLLCSAPTAMTPILFAFKRNFHKSVALGLRLLKDHDLTPARFDMLHVVFINRGSMYQSVLRRILGVRTPTVSRMLVSLEKLGLVRRHIPTEGDRRQRSVTLTPEGRERIRNAMRAMFYKEVAQLAVDKIVLFLPPKRIIARLNEWAALNDKLYFMRRRLGDTATLQYQATGMD